MNGASVRVRFLSAAILAAVGLLAACSQSDTASSSPSSVDASAGEVSIQPRLFLVESEAWLRGAGIATSSASVDRLDDLQAKMLTALADASAEAAMIQVPSVTVDADSAAQRITFRKVDTGLAEDVAVDLNAQSPISQQTIALTLEPYGMRVSLPNRSTGLIRLPLTPETLGTGHESRVAYLLLRPAMTMDELPTDTLR